MKGPRLDAWLVEHGFAETRARAQALVLAGKVRIGDKRADKAGLAVPDGAEVAVDSDDGWASRGAHKLLGAIAAFPELAARVPGARALDVGASTGGFTDVLLRHGAAHVIALDVGWGQLHERLRQDARVTVLDRTNIRLLPAGALAYAPDLAVCDASFISVRLFLDVVFRELAASGPLLRPGEAPVRGRQGQGRQGWGGARRRPARRGARGGDRRRGHGRLRRPGPRRVPARGPGRQPRVAPPAREARRRAARPDRNDC